MNNNINNNDHDSLDDSNISINYSTSNEPLPKIDKLVSLGLTNADAINKKFVQIKENIHGFGDTVNNVVKQHHIQYIKTFDEFMNKVRSDFKRETDVIKQSEKMKRKKEDIVLIMTERDFFKNESIRLNQYCKDLSTGLETLGHDYQTQVSEIIILQNKWKKSEIVNKKLLIELEQNMQIIKNLENQLQDAKLALNINTNLGNLSNTEQINKLNKSIDSKIRQTTAVSVEKSIKDKVEKSIKEDVMATLIKNEDSVDLETWLESKGEKNKANLFSHDPTIENLKKQFFHVLNKLKSDLKSEKMKNSKLSLEIIRLQQSRSNSEKIFQECVESTKKEILNRKAKATLIYGNKSQYAVNNLLNSSKTSNYKYESTIEDITIDNFKTADKSKQMKTISDNVEKENKMNKSKYSFKNMTLQTFYSKNKFLAKNTNNSEPYLLTDNS